MFHKKHEEIHQKIAKNFNKSNELIMKSPPFSLKGALIQWELDALHRVLVEGPNLDYSSRFSEAKVGFKKTNL